MWQGKEIAQRGYQFSPRSPIRAVACAGIEPALSRLRDGCRCQLDQQAEAPRSGNDPLASRSTDERSATELARRNGPVGGIRIRDLRHGKTALQAMRMARSESNR